jgi:hypothetical protein
MATNYPRTLPSGAGGGRYAAAPVSNPYRNPSGYPSGAAMNPSAAPSYRAPIRNPAPSTTTTTVSEKPSKTFVITDGPTVTETSITQPKTWCWPFIIFVILVILNIILMLFAMFMNRNPKITLIHKIGSFLFAIIYYFLWGWLIYYLCSRGSTGAAWAVLLIPIFIGFFVTLLLLALAGGFIAGTAVGPYHPTP